MFTVCSKCNLRLTVTATDLRAAQGYVRCGRCHNVFNALAALADDPTRQAEAATSADTQRRPVLTQPEPPHPEAAAEPAPEAVPTPEPEPEPEPAPDTSLEFNPASTNINEVFIEATASERTGTFESIVLAGEEAAAAVLPSDPVIAPQALSAPAAPEPVQAVTVDVQRMRDALADLPASEADVSGSHETIDDIESDASDAETPESTGERIPIQQDAFLGVDESAALEIAHAIEAEQAQAGPVEPGLDAPEAELLRPVRPRPPLSPFVLQISALVLALCLLAQVVHHHRAALADTALLQRPLTAFYGALGLPIAARWNIADYEVRQLGATTDGAAAGDLVVRASISNRAARDQPLPLLRVVMQDRFGNRVAGRDLQPAEYLGAGAPQVSLMTPGQRVDVQVAFHDPGQAATGFEIDACMPRPDHTVTCANDANGH